MLDSTTGKFAGLPTGGVTIGNTYVRLALSSDETHLYYNVEGSVGYYDVASGQSVNAPFSSSMYSTGTQEHSGIVFRCPCGSRRISAHSSQITGTAAWSQSPALPGMALRLSI
jgi:hypothetical protein